MVVAFMSVTVGLTVSILTVADACSELLPQLSTSHASTVCDPS